jgi:hypothetical protein
VRAAFRADLGARLALPETDLTEHDCSVVRRSFQFPSRTDFTWPSVDLQARAVTPDASTLEWIIAELHIWWAPLQHSTEWAAPRPDRLASQCRRIAGESRWVVLGDPPIPEHITPPLARALGDKLVFVGGERCAGAASYRPADIDIYRREMDGDIRIRETASGLDLGSISLSGRTFFGLHPFSFAADEHTPRLRIGGVIVQRRSWLVTAAAVAPADASETDWLLGLHTLRARLGLPRWIYVRPTPDLLNRSRAMGRDKDVKPVFIDLDSLPFLDMLARWLAKYGELEASEMMPAPDELVWPSSDGKRCYELRTLLVPR